VDYKPKHVVGFDKYFVEVLACDRWLFLPFFQLSFACKLITDMATVQNLQFISEKLNLLNLYFSRKIK
jgi:hypothetical protein